MAKPGHDRQLAGREEHVSMPMPRFDTTFEKWVNKQQTAMPVSVTGPRRLELAGVANFGG